MKYLNEQEFISTMSDPMKPINEGGEVPFDFWSYYDQIPESDFGGYDCSEEIVENVYRNNDGSYEHVMVNSNDQNAFMVLVLDLKNKKVFGHKLLDLNIEYGLKT